MKDLVKTGTKFFVGHNEDNSTNNRKDVGQVVTSFVKEINGKLSNIVVGHFPSEESVSNMDIISMEADIDTDMYNNVNDVKGITGIAMGSSKSESPAFPGAKLMSAIQCFESDEEKIKNLEKEKPMTFAEAKQFIKDHNVHPSQLYTEKEIQSDREFTHIFDENSKLKADNELLNKNNEELKTTSAEAVKESGQRVAKDTLGTLMTEGFTDKQKDFINKRFDPATLDDVSEDGIKKYLVNAQKEYSEFAKIFGGTEEKIVTGGDKTKVKETDVGTGDPVADALAELEKE